MLEIKNLSKRYITKNYICDALKNVNIKFPEKGLIFIVGKSGSGKSTLLNLIGGVDLPTSGQVCYGNYNIHKNNSTFAAYRSNCIGFIFQDYCLIESMSVYENIEISLSLQGKENKDLVNQTIKDVDLEEKTHTKVNLLSGGQKQRVAIARALIKNPPILLADEPTGNLDSKSSEQIFNLLEELAKEKLVIVISHNLLEAYKYADRIIELKEGEIVLDLDKDSQYDRNIDYAFLQGTSSIDENTIKNINEKIKDTSVRIAKHKQLFKKHNEENDSIKNTNIPKNKIKLSKQFNIFKYFIKKKLISMSFTSIMISILIILMGLCQAYNNVNENKLLNDAISIDTTPLIFKKGYYDEFTNKDNFTYLGNVSDEDVQSFYDAGYDGDTYKLYKFPIPLRTGACSISNGVAVYTLNFEANGILRNQYGMGVLHCNEQYLTKLYGIDGKLNVLAGDLHKNSYGLIVTDYFADSFLSKNHEYISTSGNLYAKLIDAEKPLVHRFTINAVIDTGYKTRYAYLIEQIENAKKFPASKNKILQELSKHELTKQFMLESVNYLAIGYAIEEGFVESTIENSKDNCIISCFENFAWKDKNGIDMNMTDITFTALMSDEAVVKINPPIENGDMYVNYKLYNHLFNGSLTEKDHSTFKEQTVTIELYTANRKIDDEPLFSKTYTIKGVYTKEYHNGLVVFSDDDFKELRTQTLKPYALYFDEGTNNSALYLNAKKHSFDNLSPYVTAVSNIVDVTIIFKSLFVIILFGLFLSALLLLTSYSVKTVNSFKRELGIILTMGGKTLNFSLPFVMIDLLIGVIAGIISIIGIPYICNTVNQIVTTAFYDNLLIEELLSLKLIESSPNVLIYDLLILFAVILISAISPIISLKRLKVVDILRRE